MNRLVHYVGFSKFQIGSQKQLIPKWNLGISLKNGIATDDSNLTGNNEGFDSILVNSRMIFDKGIQTRVFGCFYES